MKSLKRILFFFIVLVFNLIQAQKLQFQNEKNKDGSISIYADNIYKCPLSVEIDFSLKNMKREEKNNHIFVIPPSSKKFLITTLSPKKKGKKYSFSSKSKIWYGDVTQEINTDYEYSLPYNISESYLVSQGYGGKKSHKNEFSLDFDMPVGTEITTIREGVVIEVVQKFNKNCPSKKCAKFNNYVIISHKDGTIAKYLHIKKGGARVKIGDEVKKGQLVALSGNVGWSTGAHLHLEINGFVKGAYQTIKTQFKISKEKGNVYLEEDDNFVREL